MFRAVYRQNKQSQVRILNEQVRLIAGDNDGLIPGMAKKKKENINIFCNRRIADAFRKVAEQYLGRLGLCHSAAMLLFMEADPRTQADYLNRVYRAELDEAVEKLLEEVRGEQRKRVLERDEKEKAKT